MMKRLKKIMAMGMICSMVVLSAMPVKAATMERSMKWAGAGIAVAIGNSYTDLNYTSQCVLYAYSKADQGGNLLYAKVSDETIGVAYLATGESGIKSAYAKHYALSYGKVVVKHTYNKNKGEAYYFND